MGDWTICSAASRMWPISASDGPIIAISGRRFWTSQIRFVSHVGMTANSYRRRALAIASRRNSVGSATRMDDVNTAIFGLIAGPCLEYSDSFRSSVAA